jgi:TonB family protein
MSIIRFAILGLMLTLACSVIYAQEAPKADTSPNAPPATVPDSAEGLQAQLGRILDLEKREKQSDSEAAINELEMPEDAGWFTQVFGPELGAKLSATYKLSWTNYRDTVSSQFRSDADVSALSVRVTIYPDSSGHSSDFIASHVISDMKSPAPLYEASAVTVEGQRRSLPGYYVYARGAFRILNLQTLYLLPDVRPMRIRVGANVAKSSLIYQAVPVYPPEAKKKLIVGKVVLHIIIALDGTVRQVEIVNSDEVHPLLCQAAMDAVKQWRYKPVLFNGEPVEVDTTTSVTFTLGNS